MPLVLSIESELDERSANAAADRAQRIYTNAAQDMSRSLSEGLTQGARQGGRAVEEMADRARRSYQQVGEATDAVAQQERVLREMREQGARGVEVQAERVRRARRQEREAIREAAAAYDEYEDAARRASDTASQGFSGTAGAALGAGRDAAENFVSGFTGASALTRLASGAGLAGGVVAGFAALGTMGVKVFVDQVEQGLQRLQVRDMFQVRMGVDESTMAGYGREAADALANGWGTSVADNLRTLQFGVQGGLIDRDAADEDVQKFIEQTQAMSGILEEDAQQIARGTRNFINTGLVGSYEDAFNLILAANAQGLNISDDLLDTFEEYGTKFRDLGLNGADALGLINQMWEGGARNVDVAADGLKEFAITVTDGSELTGQAFEALGFNAEEMKRRFIEGGEVARTSFGEIITALRELDAEEREQVGLALFKTKWEDMGDAVNNLDLSRAGTELGSVGGAIDQATQRLSEHVSGWDLLRTKVDTTVGDIQSRLADSFIGEIFTGGLPNFLSIVVFDESQAGSTRPTGPSGPPPIGFTPTNPLLPPGMGPQPATVAPPTVGPGNLGQYQDLFPFLVPPPGGSPAPSVPPATRQAPVPMPDAGAGGAGSQSLPAAPVLPIQYTPTAGLPTAVANAQTRLDEAAHDAAEKQARVNQLEQSNIATADDIQKAKNDLLQSQQRQQQAERALQDAQISATEKYTNQLSSATSSMSELGAGLDSDFGISKGLAGIADNLVRFLGAIATAPLMGQLSAISNAAGDEGSGLMGILASTGALGPQFMPTRPMGPTAWQPGYHERRIPWRHSPPVQCSGWPLHPRGPRRPDSRPGRLFQCD